MRIDMISTFKERADYHLVTKNLKDNNPVKTKVSFIVGVVDKETVRMNLHFLRHENMSNNLVIQPTEIYLGLNYEFYHSDDEEGADRDQDGGERHIDGLDAPDRQPLPPGVGGKGRQSGQVARTPLRLL